MLKPKKIVVSVISDLVSDQRVHKVCLYLHDKGYDVSLIGRKFSYSLILEERVYKTERIRCHYDKGITQYIEFTIKLWVRLFFHKTDIFLSNDLDTLLPNYIHAYLRRKKLVYDSHEYFTGTPELQHKPTKRKIWKALENYLLPKVKFAYTVNDSIARLYNQEYGISMKVVRNLPPLLQAEVAESGKLFAEGKFVLLMQGAGINVERGAEEMIESMLLLPDQFMLVLIGGGNAWKNLKRKTEALNLQLKVLFIEKVPFSVLNTYTRQAHLGLSLDKPLCINHQLSLPNKIFDYIQAGIPVLASSVVEVQKIINHYNVGVCIDTIAPSVIAEAIMSIYNDQEKYDCWKSNTKKAAIELCWENEISKLDLIYEKL